MTSEITWTGSPRKGLLRTFKNKIMKKTKNLMEGLLEEMNRVRELIAEYKSLPNGAGMIGAGLMTVDIRLAEKAISNGDTIQMMVQYEKLKSCNEDERMDKVTRM